LAKPQPDFIDKLDISFEIKYISDVLTSYANLNGVTIEIENETDKALFILGDRQKFRQSIINIAKNSIEAMSDPKSGVLKFVVSTKKNWVFLIIKDTGVGMNPDQVSRLGSPYYSTKEKGTGLGTMVSFSILKAMMGKVEVKSELGKGTEYNIFFPVA
jgi:two-component system, sporulation sensor kinase B